MERIRNRKQVTKTRTNVTLLSGSAMADQETIRDKGLCSPSLIQFRLPGSAQTCRQIGWSCVHEHQSH